MSHRNNNCGCCNGCCCRDGSPQELLADAVFPGYPFSIQGPNLSGTYALSLASGQVSWGATKIVSGQAQLPGYCLDSNGNLVFQSVWLPTTITAIISVSCEDHGGACVFGYTISALDSGIDVGCTWLDGSDLITIHPPGHYGGGSFNFVNGGFPSPADCKSFTPLQDSHIKIYNAP